MPRITRAAALSLYLAAGNLLTGCPTSDGPPQYTVFIENNSNQPLGPVVAATHATGVVVWEEGQLASSGMGTLAETGDIAELFSELQAQSKVTDVVSARIPMPSQGRVVPRFAPGTVGGPDLVDNQRITITAQSGDLISLASGLLGTNDGFWGLDAVALPESGSLIYFARGYDAGTEENNELEAFVNDDASRLGPEVIPGDDPDTETAVDNRRDATTPPQGIRAHAGISGENDIPVAYDFEGILLQVTITAVETP